MPATVQLRFDYAALDAETRRFVIERTERIHALARATAASIVEIGKHLTEVKAELEHGKFLEWIEREFAWSRFSADRFMNVFERVKSSNLQQMQIDVSALYLIAAPSTPEPVREEVISRAAVERVTHSTVKAVLTEYRKTGDAPKAAGRIFDAVREAQQRDAIQARALPSPAEARRTAIATGAHTLDRNGAYQPPMTVADQERWRGDLVRLAPISDFVEWAAEAPLTPAQAVALIYQRDWMKTFENTPKAARWMAQFEGELCRKQRSGK